MTNGNKPSAWPGFLCMTAGALVTCAIIYWGHVEFERTYKPGMVGWYIVKALER